jgi:predicted TPR repeat methyltransferase
LHREGRTAEAADLYRRVLARDPNNAEALNLLGVIRTQQGDFGTAVKLLRKAARLNPGSSTAQTNLGTALAAASELTGAARAFRRALSLRPDDDVATCNLAMTADVAGDVVATTRGFRRAAHASAGNAAARLGLAHAYLKDGRLDEARVACEAALAVDPRNEEAAFLGDALAARVPPRPPPSYVAGLFDKYAANFDRNLTERLAYRTPEIMAGELRRLLPEGSRRLDVLDLGCGTGLAGAAVRDLAKTLVGVDLSPRMLAHAKRRGIYSKLIADDLVAGMERLSPASFDLVLAADVFNYFGDLGPCFSAARRVLRPEGMLAFSTEAGGDAVALQMTLRYTHAPDHVASVLAAAGFAHKHTVRATLRRESNRDVAGDLFFALCGRTGQDAGVKV